MSLMPEVDSAGTYQLVVTSISNNCSAIATAIVTIDTIPPTANAGMDTMITCGNPIIILEATGSSAGSDFSYEWNTMDGNFLGNNNAFTVEVDSAGTYALTVTNNLTGCTSIDEIVVGENYSPSVADAGVDDELDCSSTTIVLGGTNSSTGADFIYQWTASNGGNIFSGKNEAMVTVDAAGTYELLVTNLVSGCTSIDTTIVTQNADLPNADAGTVDLIPCLTGELTLDGNASSTGSEFEYLWTTGDGHFVSGETTLFPIVDSVGVYLLTVTNTQNNCSASDAIIVTYENCDIIAEAGANTSVGCGTTTVTLDGSGSSTGTDVVYQWTTNDGTIVSGETTLTPTVDGVGTYVLTVVDTLLNNSAQDSVEVTSSQDFPTVIVNANGFLSCSDTTVFLTSNGSSSGTNFVYSWTTIDGNIVAVVGGSNVLVNEVGWYYLEIMNMTNGCSSIDSVEVIQDTSLPIADAGVDTSLNCYSDTIVLNGLNSSVGPDLEYLWTTQDGNILLGDTTLSPTVDSVGIYTLTITNLSNNCTVASSVEVIEDFDPPLSSIISPINLNCVDTVLILDGTGSSVGGNINYEWQTINGNIFSGGNTASASIDTDGEYDLIVTNISNGCQDTSTVLVTLDTIPPIAIAGADMNLDCGIASIMLDGTGSSATGVQYQWSTSDGTMIAGQQTPMLEVSSGGIYILTVQNNINGCVATDEVLVTQPNCTPVASIVTADTITCIQTQVTLDGSASSDWVTIVYEWTTSNGTIIGNSNTPIISVGSAGDYQLTITDQLTGLTTSTSITVFDNNENPIAQAGLPDTLNCLITSIILDGTASSLGNNFTYEWTTNDGNILNDIDILTPTIDAPGTYQLVVTNMDNFCTAISNVVIEIDTIAPIADAGTNLTLTCDNPILTLDAAASSTGNEFTYNWGTDFGNILNGNGTTQPQINGAGNYALAVTNIQNECIATDFIIVDVDTITPTINIEVPLELNCTVTTVDLDGSNSSGGNEFSYEWTTFNGNILNGNTNLISEVNEPGEYLFFIENNNNGCTATENIIVTQDTIHPIAIADIPDELNCVDTVVIIDGSASSMGNEFSYNWTTALGNIIDGDDDVQPSVNEPGIYQIEVTNTNNTCTAITSIEVTQDIELPQAMIEPANDLNCVVPSFDLNANNSSTGLEFDYSWTTIEGNFVSGEMTLNPTINEGGIYSLTVTNVQNGCTADAAITIGQDTLLPIANAGSEMTLTCIDTVFILNGNNSSLGNEYQYLWTTTNGNIVNGETGLTPLIDEPGQYQIQVLNTVNQCSSVNSVEISQDITPPTSVIDAIGGLVITCDINSIILDGTGSLPFGEVSFEWSTLNGNISSGPNTPSPEIDLAGNYFVVLTNDNNGCTATDNIVITENFEAPLIAVSTPDILTCIDTIISLSGTGSSTGTNFSYQWSTLNGNILSGENEIQSQVDEPGTYIFSVTDNNNGCTIDTSITVLQNIELPMADAGVSYEFDCISPNLTLEGIASQGDEFIYQWTTQNGNILLGESTLNPIVNMKGVYTLSVTNTINGCVASSDATVTEDMDIPQNANFEITSPLCHGEYNGSIQVTEVFGGEPPYQFSFNNSGSFADYDELLNLGAGSYSVAVRDASGCEWETVIVIEDPDLVVVELGDDIHIELGEEVELEAQTNIPMSDLAEVEWISSDSIPCADCLVLDLSPIETSGYAVTLTTENGCVTEDDVLIFVENKKRIFIPNAFSPDNDGNNDVFMIYGGIGVEEVEEFMIFNRWGELIFEQNHFQTNDPVYGWNGFYRGKKLNPAVFVYFAKIKYLNGESEIFKGDLFLK